MPEVDQLILNFDRGFLFILNFLIGFMMFGVALDMRWSDFKWIVKSPKGPIIGLISQFLLLPAFTYVLTLILDPAPSIALGMILVAACPGGNVSNIVTHLARGNTALSVSMTAISTALAVVMTPFNIAFWGSLNPKTAELLKVVSLQPFDVFQTIFMILGVPLMLGLYVSHKYPAFARKTQKPMRIFAFTFFLAVVIGALVGNWTNFVKYIGYVVFAVMIHNALALSTGYFSARALRLPVRDAKAVSIETGIQNSALGLILIFDFFNKLGGMALVAAWWGIWHLVAGGAMALLWSRGGEEEISSPEPERAAS